MANLTRWDLRKRRLPTKQQGGLPNLLKSKFLGKVHYK